MKRNVIALALCTVLAISVVGCSSNNTENKNIASDNSKIAIEDTDILSGTWSEDYSRDEVKSLFDKALASVESTAKGYSLEYEVTENEIKEENGESTNDTYVYLDIPEAERLESMYFGFKQYGSDLASGKLEMKMGYNLDRKTILEGQKFEFENLSLAAFSQAFTGNYERDYTELDKQIYDIIKNGTGDEIQTIENNLDGLKETIKTLGERFDKNDKANEILKELEDKEASLDNKEKNDEKVMILFGAPGSVMIGTDKSYTGNLVQICGGNNVFSEGNSSYIQVNMEEIIKANPDKILVTMHALPDETKKTVAEELAKDSWKSINAVKNNKVIYLDSEYFGMSANLKVIEALDLLGDILYEQ